MTRIEFAEVQTLHTWQILTVEDASIALAMVVEYYDEQRRLSGLLSLKVDRLAYALRIPFPLSLYGRFVSMLMYAQAEAIRDGFAVIDQQTARRLYKIASYCSRQLPAQDTNDDEPFITKQDCLEVKYKFYDAV